MDKKIQNIRTATKILRIVLGVFTIYLFVFPIIPKIVYKIQANSLLAPALALPADIVAKYDSGEPWVVIPKALVSRSVVEVKTIKQMHENVWRWPESSTPDAGGNTVMLSHRYATIGGNRASTFYNLPELIEGDSIFVEAGSVHALLQGTLVAEIQQNSDVTYRVYDWGRLGTDGKPRPLHVDKALAVINFEQVEPGPYQPRPVGQSKGVTRYEISRCRYFVVEKVTFEAGATFKGHTNGATLEIWGAVNGTGTIFAPPAPLVKLPAVRFCLIPAVLGHFSVTAQTNCTMLRAYLP